MGNACVRKVLWDPLAKSRFAQKIAVLRWGAEFAIKTTDDVCVLKDGPDRRAMFSK